MNSDDKVKQIENKLEDIYNKLDESEISLQEIDSLFSQASNLDTEGAEDSSKAKVLANEIFFTSYQRAKEYFFKKGKKNLTDQELDLLEQRVDFYQENASKFLWDEIPLRVRKVYKGPNDFNSSVMKETNEAKSVIQEEKRNRKGSTAATNQQENSAQNTQQIQKLQKEIDSLNTQLIELQKQIGELLELLKKSQESNNQSAKQEIEQKLTKVQTQQQQVQKQLESKNQTKQQVEQRANEINSTNKEENQTQSKETNPTQDKFNWWWVGVPVGILVLALGGIAVYFYSKKEAKKE
jgi:predicted RNase H-like nuclease (RuvC/YqgF family)